VTENIVHQRGTTLVRRLQLAPGEAMPWHRDPYHRVSVILSGDALGIEYRDGSPTNHIPVTPGQVDWDEPTDRVHRAVNVGAAPCFPVILAEFVREERFLALPDAIRKMTSFPAQRLGLPDRGLLRDGFKADVVVFDAKMVKAPATRTQPKQFPIGIDYVLVNGQVVVDSGKHTGMLAGRALRRGRAST
jgi:N-acyl-D-aspartate/D-glutamate deacylase